MTSRDFSYKWSVALPLISSTNLELNILVLSYVESYGLNSNTPPAIRPAISCFRDCSKGAPGVVITPSFRSLTARSISACSFAVRKISETRASFSLTFRDFVIVRPLLQGGSSAIRSVVSSSESLESSPLESLCSKGSEQYGFTTVDRNFVGPKGSWTTQFSPLVATSLNGPFQPSFSRHTRTSESRGRLRVGRVFGPFLIPKASDTWRLEWSS